MTDRSWYVPMPTPAGAWKIPYFGSKTRMQNQLKISIQGQGLYVWSTPYCLS